MKLKRLIVMCETSGRVRRAFRAIGWDAWSCDILPAKDNSPYHIRDDARRVLRYGDPSGGPSWDMMIAHPPCTYLCRSGLHWNAKDPTREEKTIDALDFVQELLDANIPKIALENPIGCISTGIRKPDQIIQPYRFGHDASKATCLWLKNLPLLVQTQYVPPRIVDGKERWANQTDTGNNILVPGEDRWAERSLTYSGIAQAMANQWGDLP